MPAGHLLQIGPGTEVSIGARQNDCSNIGVLVGLDEGVVHANEHLAIDRVLTLRSIERDDRKVAMPVGQYCWGVCGGLRCGWVCSTHGLQWFCEWFWGFKSRAPLSVVESVGLDTSVEVDRSQSGYVVPSFVASSLAASGKMFFTMNGSVMIA